MRSELFHNEFTIIGNGYPNLISGTQWKLLHESLGDIDNPLPSGSYVKTACSSFFHLYEIKQILISSVNFIRNHKINITTFSYSFIRKVMKWRIR